MMHKLVLGAVALVLMVPMSAAAKTYDKDFVGETEVYRAKYEDTLVHLARNNGLGFVEIRAANPKLDPWIPGEGARVILPKQHILPDAPRKDIVINLAEMRLYHYGTGASTPLSYSIGIGREGLRTPLGQTTVEGKKVGPTWTPTERMRREDPTLPPFIPPGPTNPLGTHALYLGFPQIRIHGTDKPYGIGRRLSSGCIRMYPEGIVDLYPRVPVGTKVTVVDQPVKVGWIENKMYVEVSPTQEQSLAIEEDGELKSYEITKEDMKRITAKAGEHADLIDWESVREAVREHAGYPVPVLDLRKKPGERIRNDLQARNNDGTNFADAKAEPVSAEVKKAPVKDTQVMDESGRRVEKKTAPKNNAPRKQPPQPPRFND